MLKYMEICIDLQLNRSAKDGLHQYRNIAQQVWEVGDVFVGQAYEFIF